MRTLAMKVVTNNVPRDVIDAWRLTREERVEFDYLDWEAIDAGTDTASFVRFSQGSIVRSRGIQP
jgi:hypothetical protein